MRAALVPTCLLLVAAAVGCDARDEADEGRRPPRAATPAATPPAPPTPPAPEGPGEAGDPAIGDFAARLVADARGHGYAGRERLLARLRASPHAFFRSVNVAFADGVCARFADLIHDAPEVNLHGDAHLEQYAVTDEGRGLTDFDAATTGPAIVDAARLLVSIALTLRERGWSGDLERVLDAAEEGYREGLGSGETIPPPPAFVRRVRAATARPRLASLAEAERAMGPVDPAREAAVRRGMEAYARERHADDPDLPAGYFTTKRVGTLTLGIGSALDEKYLFRVEGPSDAADDDLLLEAKEVRSLAGISCLGTAQSENPLRILIASSRLAYAPYAHVGFFRGKERNFWIHAWQTNYHELSITPGPLASPRDVDELVGVVRDAACQLGRGHPRDVAAPLAHRMEAYVADRSIEQLRAARARLAPLVEAVIEAWTAFRAAPGSPEVSAPRR